MSKTYHKFVSFKDNDCGFAKFDKRNANKKVRNFNEYLPNGNKYKLLFNSWNIHDYVCTYYTKEEILEAIKSWECFKIRYTKELNKLTRARCLYKEKIFTRKSIRFSLDI